MVFSLLYLSNGKACQDSNLGRLVGKSERFLCANYIMTSINTAQTNKHIDTYKLAQQSDQSHEALNEITSDFH